MITTPPLPPSPHRMISSFMFVMGYTGEVQHSATRNTKGVWTTAFAIQKIPTPYCPFWYEYRLGQGAGRGQP